MAVAELLRVGAATTSRPSGRAGGPRGAQCLAVVYEGRFGFCVVLDLQTNFMSMPHEKPLVWGADGLLGTRPVSTFWVFLRVLHRAGTASVLGRAGESHTLDTEKVQSVFLRAGSCLPCTAPAASRWPVPRLILLQLP